VALSVAEAARLMEIGALCKSAVVVARRRNEAISRVTLSQFFALVFLRHRGISLLQQRSE
jgi:hypothetical protein